MGLLNRRGGPPVVAVAVFVAVAAFPWLLPDSEKMVLHDTARAALDPSLQFVRLSDGVTHYDLGGPEDGPKVVLVHGLSSPMNIWHDTVGALRDAGFRVLRYDLYGRGYSDRPKVEYGAELYDRQLVELLDTLGFTEPVAVAGLSMGGAITANFAARHPERVRQVAFFAPAGLMGGLGLKGVLVNVPGLGEWAARILIAPWIRDDIIDKMGLTGDDWTMMDRAYAEQMQFKGYRHAVLSSVRHMNMAALEFEYAAIGAAGIPIALFWGSEDRVVPTALKDRVRVFVPQAEVHVVPDAGHNTPMSHDAIVNPLLIAFLQQGAV